VFVSLFTLQILILDEPTNHLDLDTIDALVGMRVMGVGCVGCVGCAENGGRLID